MYVGIVLIATVVIAADPEKGPRIDSIAGTGKAGYAGDGGPASKAQLNQPFHFALDTAGDLYVADALNHCIRKIELKSGNISTVAGSGKKGYTGDGGPATKATLNEPYAVVVAGNGDLYIADRLNAVVRKVDAKSGNITTVAGNGKKGFAGDGGKGVEAQLREPNDLWLDGKDGLLIADVGDWRIRRLDLKSGDITTIAGKGKPKGKVEGKLKGDGGPADKSILVGPRGVCMDAKGNIYICERNGHAIRKIDEKGNISTIAGTGDKGYAGDGGPATKATFDGPKGIRCDKEGNLFVVDTENQAIRRVDATSGTITTVAGGRRGGAGDGGAADKAALDRPHGCIIDDRGVLYIADSENHRVRRVKPGSP